MSLITSLGLLFVATSGFDNTPQKPAPIYDEKARAESIIADAVAHAKKGNRRVLIQWGANWCPWCHVLNRYLTTDKELARIMLNKYDFVLADVGRRTKNMELAKHYGIDLTTNGIPYLTVLDWDGKVVVNQPTEPFERVNKTADKEPCQTEPSYESGKLAEILKKYQAPEKAVLR
jgi:thioredoxin-related protein